MPPSRIGGASLLAQTVEQATGMRLDHYAEIGFDGFDQMVDAVGGVTMCLPRAHQRPARGHRAARRLPGTRRPERSGLRAQPRHAASRPRPHGQPAPVHVGADAPRRPARRCWRTRCAGIRWRTPPSGSVTVDDGAHVWDLARLAWSLHGTVTTTTVPIGEFTGSDSGSVVVWNSDEASRLFTALAADEAVPPTCSTLASPSRALPTDGTRANLQSAAVTAVTALRSSLPELGIPLMTGHLTCTIVAVMTDATTLDTKFHHLLHDQIRTEFTASQQYIAIAVHFDGADLPQLAKHFYAQAVEERNHAMMLVQYLIDRDVEVRDPRHRSGAQRRSPRRPTRCASRSTRSGRSPSRSAGSPPSPATRATTSASSSCSGSSRSRSRRSR